MEVKEEKVDDYTLTKKLGRGSFGEVLLTTKKGTNQLFATKKIIKELALDDSLKRYFNNEIYILKRISHPQIIKLFELKSNDKFFYLIFENCNGGGLSNCLEQHKKKYNQPFTQEIVQYLMRQIVLGVKYLHNSRILHRDLKLDNILVCFQNDKDKEDLDMLKCYIKIIDFGFARYLSSGKLAQSVLGSPINMDPQILSKMKKIDNAQTFGYDEKADIWSLGTITYELLIGSPPFEGSDSTKILEKISNGSYNIPNNLKLSRESISFINAQLQYDPKERLDINQLINHEFLQKPCQRFTEIDVSRLPMEVNNSQDIVLNIKNLKNIWYLFDQTNNLGQIDSRMINSNQNSGFNYNQLNHMPVTNLREQQDDYFGNIVQPQYQQKQRRLTQNVRQYPLQLHYNLQHQMPVQHQYPMNQQHSPVHQQYPMQQQQLPLQKQIPLQQQNTLDQQQQLQLQQQYSPAQQQQQYTPAQQQQQLQLQQQYTPDLQQPHSPTQNKKFTIGHSSDIPQETKKLLMEAFDFLNYDEIYLGPMITPILPKTNTKLLDLNY